MKLFKKKFSSFISHFSFQKGFTLIELLIVIAILGILAAGILVAINPVQKINQANDANMKSNVGQIATALQAYYTTNQAYPAALADLVTAKELKVLPAAPTGYAYSYSINATPDVQVSFTLLAPAVAVNNIWCWRSATGQAVAQSAACAP
jgi:prepilin-type N-terminal cleavage/methylation domain-containing protein